MSAEITDIEATFVIPPAEEARAALERKSQAVLVAAGAICRLYGPQPGCLCGSVPRRCHSLALYRDFALAAVTALDKAGHLK